MKKHFLFYFLLLLAVFAACSKSSSEEEEIPPPVISGLEESYTVLVNDDLELTPVTTNDNSSTYTWLLNGKAAENALKYTFNASETGTYNLVFKVANVGGIAQKDMVVTVLERDSPPIISDIDSVYTIDLNNALKLTPTIRSESEVSYSWLLENTEVGTGKEYTFNGTKAGKYTLVLKASNKEGTTDKRIKIFVNGETLKVETSTYTVFAIELPEYLSGLENLQWEVEQASSELYRLSYTNTDSPLFAAAKDGKYVMNVTDGEISGNIEITVKKQTKTLSSYISKVFDYLPAPGQFVNKLPEYEDGDTHEDMVKKANYWLVGEDAFMITLGGWGGYVTFGFDHTIVNIPGRRDFRINGNSFGSEFGRPNAPFGGSCEPGIVMVAYDKNKNGIPDDDEWYEIKGSSNHSAENEPWYSFAVENKNDTKVYRDYEMTYYKPVKENPEVIKDPDDPFDFVLIEDYIRWQDNKNNSGYKIKNVYHSQSYYPAWVTENQLTFKGVRLPENGINEGQFVPGINDENIYFVLYAFRYGYVDNYPNTDDNSGIDIDWAIDKNGNKADLPGIDFVKVYSGINQENGWLGECSTEVERGEDLHMLGKNIETIK